MNKKIFWTVAVLSITGVLFLIVAGGEALMESNSKEETVSSGAVELYEIVIENEYIFLYEICGDDKVTVRREIYMPVRDRDMALLKAGIRVYDREEALMILEDFVS